MAIKAVCVVKGVQHDPSNAGKFRAVIDVAGLESGNEVSIQHTLNDVSPTIAAAFLEADIKQSVKDFLINSYSYTFGLLDSVRLIGALL